MELNAEPQHTNELGTISVQSLKTRRHLQFLVEWFLLALLSAGLWYSLGPGDLDKAHYPPSWMSSEYIDALRHAWVRFSILLTIGSMLLTIIYYGTSYAVTPIKIFLPFLEKFKRLTLQRATDGTQSAQANRTPNMSQELDADAERLLDRMADAEMDQISNQDKVASILRASAHSSAKLAAKMEKRINSHLTFGVLVGGAGLTVWWMSFYYGVGVSEKNLDISHFLMGTLPRITILLFIEVLAGFFLRQYRIGVEDLKYFLELRRRADAKRIAYSIFDRLNDSSAKLEFANALMQEKSDTRLVSGETTTTLNAIDKEQNEIIKVLGVVADKLETVAKAFKK